MQLETETHTHTSKMPRQRKTAQTHQSRLSGRPLQAGTAEARSNPETAEDRSNSSVAVSPTSVHICHDQAKNLTNHQIDTHDRPWSQKNLVSNKFSQTPRPNQNVKHIPKNKLTGGYRKRLSGFRAAKQNVEFFPEFLFVTCPPSTPGVKNNIA